MIENVKSKRILYKRAEKEAQRVPLTYIQSNLPLKEIGLI